MVWKRLSDFTYETFQYVKCWCLLIGQQSVTGSVCQSFSQFVSKSVCQPLTYPVSRCAVWIAQCLISKDFILCYFYSKIFEVESSHKVNVWSCLSVSCPFNGWFDWGSESLNFFFIPSFCRSTQSMPYLDRQKLGIKKINSSSRPQSI